MTAATRIAAFLVLLVAVFAAASLAGAEIDPGVEPATHRDEGGDMNEDQSGNGATAIHDEAGVVSGTHSPSTLPGLAVTQDGYQLVPDQTELSAGPSALFSFRIADAGGATLTDFDLKHDRRMHLILVRRDFVNFQHVHPRQLADGAWQAGVDLDPAGVYRVFADFSTADRSLTLASDVFVAGEFRPEPLPAATDTADAGDGYEVSIESSGKQSGVAVPVQFTVTRDGRELDSIEPYLGDDGHLVALREHDQAFLHTPPRTNLAEQA